jgi:hypothetical protein
MADGGAVERRKVRAYLAPSPAARKSHAIRIVFKEKFSLQNCISNRFWSKNRSHRKQTTKPPLTGSRFAHKQSSFFAHSVAQHRGFCNRSRPLLPGSAQNIENDVTYSKQTIGEFLPGATTHVSDFTLLQNSVTAAPRGSAVQGKAGASSRTPKERKPVHPYRSCPIERRTRDARGCGRWNRVGSIRTAHRSLGHADQ